MLTMRNADMHRKSPSAEYSYRRLRQMDIAVLVLLAAMAILAFWNVSTLISMFSSDVPDLAELGVITEHPSTRLMYPVGLLALALFLFKEWQYGERTLGMWYMLLPMLALVLVPTASAELQPSVRDKVVEFTLTRCPAGAMEGDTLLDPEACSITAIHESEVFLADSDPLDGDFELLSPQSDSNGGAKWTVAGTGKYKIYFLVEQDSPEVCASSRFSSNVDAEDRLANTCLVHDGYSYSVHPFVTDYMSNGWLVVYQSMP